MNLDDTIAAISSGVGPAARMIVRVSGKQSGAIVRELGISDYTAGTACKCRISFAGLSVPAWVYCFRSPHSYTGEDSAEFHIPGNPVLVRMLLDALFGMGARAAEPGEFTARAYFNGRIDLAGAEGVAATIAAVNEQELSAARQLLAGELARRLSPVMDSIADTLALVEVGIDFSGEDVTFLSSGETARRIHEADVALERLIGESARFERLSHEPRVVLVGRPNAGKSTLLNALTGGERAVVSEVAGTTRDAISAEVALRRGMVRVTDVAGLDESETSDEIERQMRQRALREAEAADVLVLVEDASISMPRPTLPQAPDLVVRTKRDLVGRAPEAGEILVSARTGVGMNELREVLDERCFGQSLGGASLALNIRHLRAIEEARLALAQAVGCDSPELVAMDLRESLDALGSILGKLTPDDVLGRIFSGFCIGK